MQEVLPNATIVVDRFHVARHYRDGVDQLRKQEGEGYAPRFRRSSRRSSSTSCGRVANARRS